MQYFQTKGIVNCSKYIYRERDIVDLTNNGHSKPIIRIMRKWTTDFYLIPVAAVGSNRCLSTKLSPGWFLQDFFLYDALGLILRQAHVASFLSLLTSERDAVSSS